MKTLLSLVLVLCFATVALGQPPERKMTGPEMWRAARMNQLKQIGSEAWEAQKKAMGMKRPGPPPWAGKGMRRGPRGPQAPFLGRGPQGHGPKRGADLRGSDPKAEVSGDHRGHRGQRGEHGSHERNAKRHGAKKQDNRGDHKKCRNESCACKDCPNNK